MKKSVRRSYLNGKMLKPSGGWIVINSLQGGSAGGGTRMRKGLDKRGVESLLQKRWKSSFLLVALPLAGRSPDQFRSFDPCKQGGRPGTLVQGGDALLKTYYGTYGNLNVDEIHDVIPITEKAGTPAPARDGRSPLQCQGGAKGPDHWPASARREKRAWRT